MVRIGQPSTGGFEVQMVGTMPISGITRGPRGEDIYGCPAMGCTVTRTNEGNVYGHWITKHCYSANVYWCDSRGCDQYYLKEEAVSRPSLPLALMLPPSAVVALKPQEVSTPVTTGLP